MSSWFNDNCVSPIQRFCINIIKTGRIPKHIAFIMDGNRRFARKNNIVVSAGHAQGFGKISQLLKWCTTLEIEEVTVYAFSIENFKRSTEEVNALMELTRNTFTDLLNEIDEFNQNGVRVNVVGRLSLMPEDLQVLFAKAMAATKNNNELTLNITFAYTGRDEISRAASHLIDGVRDNTIATDDIDVYLISQSMDLSQPELLIRTSGETRLSDFMLWQISNTVLYFTSALWPEINVWTLLAALIHFQRNAPPAVIEESELTIPQENFLKKLNHKKRNVIERLQMC